MSEVPLQAGYFQALLVTRESGRDGTEVCVCEEFPAASEFPTEMPTHRGSAAGTSSNTRDSGRQPDFSGKNHHIFFGFL